MSSKSFKYIVIKDPHFMFGFKNRIRKSGWEKDVDDKLHQIINWCLSNDYKYVLFTGDVSEKSRKRDWSLNQLTQNKNRLRKFKQAGLTVISNMGNHDYFDGHEAITDTAFEDYVESGLIEYLGTNSNYRYFEIADGVEVQLSGVDYHDDKEKVQTALSNISTSFKPDTKLIKVCTTHSNITDAQERLTDFTYGELSQYDIDCFNCGHWHLRPSGGSVQELNNSYFLNPWNLTRVARDYHAKLDEHIPEFVAVEISWDEINQEPIMKFETVPLKVKPFSEAFNIEAINLLQQIGKSNFDFFDKIELKEEEMEADDNSLIALLGKEHSISEDAIKIAKELLS